MQEFREILDEELSTGRAYQGAIVTGKIVHIGESGIFVDIGTKSEGLLPLDQVQPQELPRLQVGDEVRVKIVKKVDGEFRLSKIAVDLEEANNKIEEAIRNQATIDIVITKKVKNGYLALAFDVLEGFAHDSNFETPPEIGDVYKAQVLEFDRKTKTLVFTRRAILREEEERKRREEFEKFKAGMVVEGEVESLTNFGAFVKLSENVTGLIHISELGWHQVKKPSEVVKKNAKVKVKILEVDPENQRISLSLKATQPDPLSLLLPGEEVTGTVDSITDFGVFVKLQNNLTGLAHISELSYKKFSHPSELFRLRQKVRAKVLKVDVDQRRLALSIKACEEDPWEKIHEKYTEGANVTGEIIEIRDNGLVVKLDDYFEGFVPLAEISVDRIDNPKRRHKVGENLGFKVLHIDKKKRRIRLSRRQFILEESRESRKGKEPEPVEYTEVKMAPPRVTLGDVIDTSKIKVEEEK